MTRGGAHRRRILAFNVKYSPNLGDGVLCECLEAALHETMTGADITSIDLAARKAYGGGGGGRQGALQVLGSLPSPVRKAAVRLPLAFQSRRKWRPHYTDGLLSGDGVVIGGGNLFSDMDLNFPTKLSLALGEAAERDLPVVVYGVGCAEHWSEAGLKMVRSALLRADLRGVFVRDEASRLNWNRLFASETVVEAEVVRDPGLLASEVFMCPKPLMPGKRVGLCIMSDLAIRYHCDVELSPGELADWYVSVAEAIVKDGGSITVFTNGSPEDKAMLIAIADRLVHAAHSVTFADPDTPADLCRTISGLDALIAFRMHAIILAYSYGVPSLALRWDTKLDAFMDSVGLAKNLVSIGDCLPSGVPSRLEAARSDLPQDALRFAVIDEARAGIARLSAVLEH
ncbi:polysaccharide pyruvyl transferase family protein [Fulvimarina sp. MAC3]|uniref:polysaccharide pyruvyl transferase family protein n=1 Tax=Fulvimarina sp. MAC3 TaxID=3148887 RepID=UPI0031FDA436